MKKFIFSFIVIILISAGIFLIYKISGNKKQNQVVQQTKAFVQDMKIQSFAFADGQDIPAKYSCDSDGVNPPLNISGVPSNAQSLALTLTDPDAANSPWVHWLVWNIATTTTSIAENSVPQQAVQGQGSNGQKNYSGPCPPSGTHHYIFTLYALDTKIGIPSYSVLTDLMTAMQGHIIEQAQLVGLYRKN